MLGFIQTVIIHHGPHIILTHHLIIHTLIRINQRKKSTHSLAMVEEDHLVVQSSVGY